MSFPEYKEWVTQVLNPRDRAGGGGPWNFETEEWYAAYAYKHLVAQALRPTSILEIGIRYGYSAHAFLTAANVPYTGVDIDDPVINSMGEQTCAWAFGMLWRTIASPRLELVKLNTQTEDIRGRVKPADFVHVDGDHTFEGATQDIERGWELTKMAMLVDDYTRIPEVRDAVEMFAAPRGIHVLVSALHKGDALLLKQP